MVVVGAVFALAIIVMALFANTLASHPPDEQNFDLIEARPGTQALEEVFTLPGVGRLVLWSIYQRDYPLTQSTILFIAVMLMTINLAVDVLYGYLDPRIRYGS